MAIWPPKPEIFISPKVWCGGFSTTASSKKLFHSRLQQRHATGNDRRNRKYYDRQHVNSNCRCGDFDHGEFEKSVGKWLRQRRITGNGNMTPKRLYCHFRLSVVVAIFWVHFIWVHFDRKLQIYCWHFHPVCRSSRYINISGFRGNIDFWVVGRCRSLSHLSGTLSSSLLNSMWSTDLPLEFRCCMSQFRYISISGGHVVIPGCPVSRLSGDTLCELCFCH